jgi:hypothetical protein
MTATEGFELSPPSEEDLDAAEAAWRSGVVRHVLGEGETWWRILRARSATQALEFAGVCYPSDANNRFTPLYRDGAIAPSAYAAAWPHAYGTTRMWAQEIYRRVPEIDGFIYESHHVSGDCIVLLQPEPKRVDVFTPGSEVLALCEHPVREMLEIEAARAQVVIDFGDDETSCG